MKIAVPTNDGVNLAEHFGRSAAFIVFEVDGNKIASQEIRQNLPHDDHALHGCGAEATDNHKNHHTGMAAILDGCSLVVCGGMGWRAAQSLEEAAIRPVIVAAAGPAAQIVTRYLAGELTPAQDGFCRCQH